MSDHNSHSSSEASGNGPNGELHLDPNEAILALRGPQHVEVVTNFSQLTKADKVAIIREAAAVLRDYLTHKSSSSSRGDSRVKPSNTGNYIGRLTNYLIYACDPDAIIRCDNEKNYGAEADFLSTGVELVQAQMKIDVEAEKREEEELKILQSQEPQLKDIPPKWITTFGKLIYCGCVALSIAYALLFWPDLNNYLQSPEVLNCTAGTIGQIAFGFCLLAAVLLAFAVLVKPKPQNKYKPIDPNDRELESKLLAIQNQPSKGMRILAGILFLACAAALVLFAGSIDGSKMPSVNETISGISSLSALICSCFFVAALILPRVVRFLRATFCPTCCNNDVTNGVLSADQLAHRDARIAAYTHGAEGSAIPNLRGLNSSESEESLTSRFGF